MFPVSYPPYKVLLADPPWSFKTYGKDGKEKAPDAHYDVMTLQDIKDLPVQDVMDRNSVLFMWAYTPMLKEGIEVMEAWGFKYVSIGLYWHKVTKDGKAPAFGLGYYTRQSLEVCLIGKRGKGVQRQSRGVRQAIVEPKREHSRKPDVTHERIMTLFPGPYLELFGRESRPGWVVWGNEATKFDEPEKKYETPLAEHIST